MREEIDASGAFVVAGEASEGDEVIAAVRREQPDLVLLDVGLSADERDPRRRDLRRALPATRIVFCSIAETTNTAIRALGAGAIGLRPKDLAPTRWSARCAARSPARPRSRGSSRDACWRSSIAPSPGRSRARRGGGRADRARVGGPRPARRR